MSTVIIASLFFVAVTEIQAKIPRIEGNSQRGVSVMLYLIQHLGMKAVMVHISIRFTKRSCQVFLSFHPFLGFDSTLLHLSEKVRCHDKADCVSHLDDVITHQS